MQSTGTTYTDAEMDRFLTMLDGIVPDCIPPAQFQLLKAVIERKIAELEVRMKGME